MRRLDSAGINHKDRPRFFLKSSLPSSCAAVASYRIWIGSHDREGKKLVYANEPRCVQDNDAGELRNGWIAGAKEID